MDHNSQVCSNWVAALILLLLLLLLLLLCDLGIVNGKEIYLIIVGDSIQPGFKGNAHWHVMVATIWRHGSAYYCVKGGNSIILVGGVDGSFKINR